MYFGKRQDPNGAYAAVIPQMGIGHDPEPGCANQWGWPDQPRFLLYRQRYSDEYPGRRAAKPAVAEVYNVAVNARTSLNELFEHLKQTLSANGVNYTKQPIYADFRAGDVLHSQADITKARTQLGYEPTHTILQGLNTAMPWYVAFLS
uniref:UDP-glucose 4-epimerase n=1 Tax=Panagrolaimus superbus TaxID=310955 RepID=A0A914ZAG7_9BILA